MAQPFDPGGGAARDGEQHRCAHLELFDAFSRSFFRGSVVVPATPKRGTGHGGGGGGGGGTNDDAGQSATSLVLLVTRLPQRIRAAQRRADLSAVSAFSLSSSRCSSSRVLQRQSTRFQRNDRLYLSLVASSAAVSQHDVPSPSPPPPPTDLSEGRWLGTAAVVPAWQVACRQGTCGALAALWARPRVYKDRQTARGEYSTSSTPSPPAPPRASNAEAKSASSPNIRGYGCCCTAVPEQREPTANSTRGLTGSPPTCWINVRTLPSHPKSFFIPSHHSARAARSTTGMSSRRKVVLYSVAAVWLCAGAATVWIGRLRADIKASLAAGVRAAPMRMQHPRTRRARSLPAAPHDHSPAASRPQIGVAGEEGGATASCTTVRAPATPRGPMQLRQFSQSSVESKAR